MFMMLIHIEKNLRLFLLFQDCGHISYYNYIYYKLYYNHKKDKKYPYYKKNKDYLTPL